MAKFNIDISATTTAFAGKVQGAINQLNSTGAGLLRGAFFRAFAAVGGAVGVGSIVSNVAHAADALKTMAIRTGVSTEKLQEWQFAAKKTGNTLEDFTQAFRFMTRAQNDAIEGNQDLQRAFGNFGVSLAMLRNNAQAPERTFDAIADFMRGHQWNPRALNDFMDIFGRGANQVLPAFIQGMDGFAKSARQFGLVWKTEVTDRLAEGADKWDIFLMRIKAGAGNILGDSRGWFQGLRQAISDATGLPMGGINNIKDPALGGDINATGTPLAPGPIGGSRAAMSIVPGGKSSTGSPLQLPQDAFAALGLFVSAGGAANQMTYLGIQKQSLNELREIKEGVIKLPGDIASNL